MDLRPVASELIALGDLCIARSRSLDQVRALMRAGLVPEPVQVQPDGTELVPLDLIPLEADPPPASPELWQGHLARELARFRDGEQRLLGSFGPERVRQREQQLMRMGSAAWGAALSLLMQGRTPLAREWFDRSAVSYRRSLAEAEPGNWGRSIGSLKCRVLAGDALGTAREAGWTLELGAASSESTTARYAACLSLLALGDAERAAAHARVLHDEPSFPVAAAEALVGVVSGDEALYGRAIRALLASFETRDAYLERIPVADTVLVIQSLARPFGLAVELESHVLPEPSAGVDG